MLRNWGLFEILNILHSRYVSVFLFLFPCTSIFIIFSLSVEDIITIGKANDKGLTQECFPITYE